MYGSIAIHGEHFLLHRLYRNLLHIGFLEDSANNYKTVSTGSIADLTINEFGQIELFNDIGMGNTNHCETITIENYDYIVEYLRTNFKKP